MEHTVVYQDPRRFAGWPANNGLWSWDGREVLAGFTVGDYRVMPGHNIAGACRNLLARSIDAGRTWQTLEPANFVGTGGELRPPPGGIDFSDPNVVLRVAGTGYHGSDYPAGAFFLSRDRGAGWLGPFSFGTLPEHPELRGMEITARTDILPAGAGGCLLVMSARPRDAALADRTFCAATADGGASFAFRSWVVPPGDPHRAAMPATVRRPDGRLVAAIRRRRAEDKRCWIEAYGSADAGRSWRSLGELADTGPWNGNPPALAVLPDGRLCCVFGDRRRSLMVARFSADGGATWAHETVLRSDFQPDVHGDPDLGYPRLAVLGNGRLLAVYYWATRELPHQHIAATAWHPD